MDSQSNQKWGERNMDKYMGTTAIRATRGSYIQADWGAHTFFKLGNNLQKTVYFYVLWYSSDKLKKKQGEDSTRILCINLLAPEFYI